MELVLRNGTIVPLTEADVAPGSRLGASCGYTLDGGFDDLAEWVDPAHARKVFGWHERQGRSVCLCVTVYDDEPDVQHFALVH